MNDLVRPPFLPPLNVDFRTQHFRVRCASAYPHSRVLPPTLIAVMEAFKYLLTSQPALQSKETAAASYGDGPRSLQSQFKAQTVRLREIYKVQRTKNTARAYEPKQEEWGVFGMRD